MQNHLSESTEEILPSAKIEMPSFQKENTQSSPVNKNTKLFKNTVRGLGVRNKYQFEISTTLFF